MNNTSINSAQAFNEYLQSKNLAEQTIKIYLVEVNRYLSYLKAEEKEAENATKKDLLNYLKKADEQRKVAASTKKSILGTIRHYYNYLNQFYGVNNITHFIKIRGVKRKQIRQPITTEELELICDAFYYENQENIKGYLILTFAAFQGLTVTEISKINKQDIDLRKATLKIHRSKKINGRTLTLKAAQIGSLMQYFTNPEQTDFKTTNFYYQSLYKKIRAISPKFEGFTQIRASLITGWIKTHGLRKAQYLAGHRYISSTENYLANDFESLQKDLESFHPLQ